MLVSTTQTRKAAKTTPAAAAAAMAAGQVMAGKALISSRISLRVAQTHAACRRMTRSVAVKTSLCKPESSLLYVCI